MTKIKPFRVFNEIDINVYVVYLISTLILFLTPDSHTRVNDGETTTFFFFSLLADDIIAGIYVCSFSLSMGVYRVKHTRSMN